MNPRDIIREEYIKFYNNFTKDCRSIQSSITRHIDLLQEIIIINDDQSKLSEIKDYELMKIAKAKNDDTLENLVRNKKSREVEMSKQYFQLKELLKQVNKRAIELGESITVMPAEILAFMK